MVTYNFFFNYEKHKNLFQCFFQDPVEVFGIGGIARS